MKDRTGLMEAALDSRPDGIALLGLDGEVVFWNRAAAAITGFESAEVLERSIPERLERLLHEAAQLNEMEPGTGLFPEHGALVHARHKLGHEVRAIARRLALRDPMGQRIGTAVAFHPADCLDALPHGQTAGSGEVDESQVDLEERLTNDFEDFERGGAPVGVLWIDVDQAHDLRKTHGVAASKAMLEKVERALRKGLRPTEALGRWGDEEFLVIAHERTAEMLAKHGQTMTGLARTADFRWWGDKLELTVSVGAAQAESHSGETLAQLLKRAQEAMGASVHAGGNHMTLAPGGQRCLP